MNRTILSRQDLTDSRSRRRLALALVAVFCMVAPLTRWQTPVSGRDQGFVPYGEEPIRYHAGFASPASGAFHDQVTEEFASTVERLLAENATASR